MTEYCTQLWGKDFKIFQPYLAINYFNFYIILQFRDKKPSYLLETRLQKALDRAVFLKLA